MVRSKTGHTAFLPRHHSLSNQTCSNAAFPFRGIRPLIECYHYLLCQYMLQGKHAQDAIEHYNCDKSMTHVCIVSLRSLSTNKMNLNKLYVFKEDWSESLQTL